jgi:ASC-1-like (ASCH) protein
MKTNCRPSKQMIHAFEEAEKISSGEIKVKSYTSFKQILKELKLI